MDIAPASLRLTDPLLTLVDSTSPSKGDDPIPSSLDLVYIYLNPDDNETSFSIGISGTVSYNAGAAPGTPEEGGPFGDDLLSYTATVDIV
jgi:hypothetical protein